MRSLEQAIDSREFSFARWRAEGQWNRAHAIGFEYEEWPEARVCRVGEVHILEAVCCIDRFKLKLAGYRTGGRPDDRASIRPGDLHAGERRADPGAIPEIDRERGRERAGSIEDLEIIGRRELERLVEDWNRTEKRLTPSQMYPRVDRGAGAVKTGVDRGRLPG